MSKWNYTKGLHDLGGGIYAYLQPDGSWGLNNAGLIVAGDSAMLVDTLYDLKLTGEMMTSIRSAVPSANIDFLVNTHANGDHTFGNELVNAGEIVSTKACAEEFSAIPPSMMSGILQGAADLGQLGEFFTNAFGRFSFENITLTPPTRTFEGELTLKVGQKDVHLIEVGPCHTTGDAIVFVPENKTVFTGDILFIGGAPILWVGPVENWIKALDDLIDMEAETYVPGHGPIVGKNGVADMKRYWQWAAEEGRKRFDAGMPLDEAAVEMLAGPFSDWTDPERIGANLYTLYRQFSGETEPGNALEAFTLMAELALKK